LGVIRRVIGMLTVSSTSADAVALAFATLLVASKYGDAHALLSTALQSAIPVAELKESYESMVAYFPKPPDQVEVLGTQDNWPTQNANDIKWVYVSLASSEGYGEAITVVVSLVAGREVLTQIEWGRP
jgi:hypothetical protein